MPHVVIEHPQIVTITYRQTQDDPDYGTCLWARFHFDTQAYTMFVESDCGGYSYGWCPTPKAETFLHLMARCEGEYILDKIARQTVIDEKETYRYVVDTLTLDGDIDSLSDGTLELIKDACRNDYPSEIVEGIYDALAGTEYTLSEDSYDLYSCITYDYPAAAKKIAEIFEMHIRPMIRQMEESA